MQPRVLIVGCGDLGRYVAELLPALGFEVTALARSPKSIQGLKVIQADVTSPSTLSHLSEIAPDYLVYCVSADQRTDAAYKAQYVDGLRNVLATQQHNAALKGVLFVSSTRVYGQETDAIITNEIVAAPSDFGGQRLYEAEQLLQTLNCHTSALRLSGIYGPGRLRMIRLAQQSTWPEKNAWSNRIHRDDAGRFIAYLLQRFQSGEPVAPHYIVTDDLPTKQYTVLEWLAAQLGLQMPNISPVLAGGKRLSNQAMKDTGFELQYPDFKEGYAALLQQQ